MQNEKPHYDAIAHDYHEFVEREYSTQSVLGLAVSSLLNRLGDVRDITLCDVGCGEGKLAHLIEEQGGHVNGVDISPELLKIAREHYPDVTFIEDDAQSLQKLGESAFDIVISNFALMDIPDLQATYKAVHRILRVDGRFIFTITHPCFQAPHADLITNNDYTIGRFIKKYATEGHWKSSYAAGIRGRVGAHHRTVSTYINELVAANFTIAHLAEPTLPVGAYESVYQQFMVEVPAVMLIETVAQSS